MAHKAQEAGQFGAGVVDAALARGTDVDACVALSRHVNGLAGQAFQVFGDAGIACRANCNFCCHLRVMVRPHEAIALFRVLGGMPGARAALVRRQVRENAARIARSGAAGPAGTRLACAFLVDGVCSAYEARPLACAAYHSLDRMRCEQDHEAAPSGEATANAGAGIPVLEGLVAALGMLSRGVDAGLAQRGLDAQPVELHTALAALIRNPALIARWRSGKALLPAGELAGR